MSPRPTIRRTTTRRRPTPPNAVFLLISVVLCVACGEADPTGPADPEVPDVVGIFAGTWNNTASVPATGQEARVSCPGSVIIKEQTPGGAISGFWTQVGEVGCPGAAGTIAGIVASGGELTITEFTNSTSPSLEEATGGQCALVSGSDSFDGFVDGRTLEISRTARAMCGTTEIAYSWELTTTRVD